MNVTYSGEFSSVSSNNTSSIILADRIRVPYSVPIYEIGCAKLAVEIISLNSFVHKLDYAGHLGSNFHIGACSYG
jgi:hypothetical protein